MKQHMKQHTQPGPWLAIALALALTACAGLPVEQRLDIANLSIGQSYNLAAELRKGGYISDSEWPKVLDGLDQASDALDRALELYLTDPAAAEEQLMSVEAIAAELKRRLLARQRDQFKNAT